MYLQPNTQCMRACMCTYNMPIHRIYTCIRMYTVYKHVYVPTASTLMPALRARFVPGFFSVLVSLSLSVSVSVSVSHVAGLSLSLSVCLSATCVRAYLRVPARTRRHVCACSSLSAHLCLCVGVRVRTCACVCLSVSVRVKNMLPAPLQPLDAASLLDSYAAPASPPAAAPAPAFPSAAAPASAVAPATPPAQPDSVSVCTFPMYTAQRDHAQCMDACVCVRSTDVSA